MRRCSFFVLLAGALLMSGCVAVHEAVTAPIDSSQSIQTRYVEQEVFVPLPWVAGSAKNILAP